jgi:hypothetical protein
VSASTCDSVCFVRKKKTLTRAACPAPEEDGRRRKTKEEKGQKNKGDTLCVFNPAEDAELL